jgi:hypothetical protein
MQTQTLRHRVLGLLAAISLLVFSGLASADPPMRVARLGFASGSVNFSPAGESDWVQASLNRPLTTGDRLWTDADSRAEIQIDGAMIRANADTAFSFLNLDDQIAQLQLTQGILSVRVRGMAADQSVEIDTPNLAFVVRQPGEYRIEVTPDGNATTVIVRKGQANVYSEDTSYAIDSRQPYRFTGTGLRDYQLVDMPYLDGFDGWANDRDFALANSGSARFVSTQVLGYQDLDAHGSWRMDASFGNVWFPNHVRLGWSPYIDGHWTWINPWGWTWVDDAPWGFAVSHYGRWANVNGVWGWVPGPARSRAYYAPALVMFLGGDNFRLTLSSNNGGDVAWFPLGPREVYRPAYRVSREYFLNVNSSNTVVNTTVINNTYNVTNVNGAVYANRHVPGAVVAVPRSVFGQSLPVARVAVHPPREGMANAQLTLGAPVAPPERPERGGVRGDRPPPRVFDRPLVAHSPSSGTPVGVAVQSPQWTVKPHDTREPPAPPTERVAPPMAASSQQHGRSEQHPRAVVSPRSDMVLPSRRVVEPNVRLPQVVSPIAPAQAMPPPMGNRQFVPAPVASAVAPQTPVARRRLLPSESVPGTGQVEPHPPVPAPAHATQVQAAPMAHEHAQGQRPAASKPKDQKMDNDEVRRPEENRKLQR